ncbi:MAG: histone deacetylase [Candidatus Heimdallarchaeota archaeon]|nr:histone deacetylase [Candidatus Heimdallarchaeota archaeon]
MLTFIEHEDYYKHKMPQILESPRRLKVIQKAIKETNLLENPYVKMASPDAVKAEDLYTIHTEHLVDTVKHGSMIGVTAITGDTLTNEFTFLAGLRAVGGAKLAAEIAIKQPDSVAYALVRPPGHHATHRNAMGFCFFNNGAFAANYLTKEQKIKKIAIIDIDNHYGNGTADLFYERSDILTLSLHADPKYSFPFQGRITEIGEREGEGYNICVPLPMEIGDKEYLTAFDRIIIPIVREYNPEVIFVSTGYDGLLGDPYGYLGQSVFGFQAIMERIANLAKEVCDGKIVMTLEGGYKFDELGDAFLASVSPLIPNYQFSKDVDSKLTSSGSKNQLKNTLDELKNILKPYWRID